MNALTLVLAAALGCADGSVDSAVNSWRDAYRVLLNGQYSVDTAVRNSQGWTSETLNVSLRGSDHFRMEMLKRSGLEEASHPFLVCNPRYMSAVVRRDESGTRVEMFAEKGDDRYLDPARKLNLLALDAIAYSCTICGQPLHLLLGNGAVQWRSSENSGRHVVVVLDNARPSRDLCFDAATLVCEPGTWRVLKKRLSLSPTRNFDFYRLEESWAEFQHQDAFRATVVTTRGAASNVPIGSENLQEVKKSTVLKFDPAVPAESEFYLSSFGLPELSGQTFGWIAFSSFRWCVAAAACAAIVWAVRRRVHARG